LREAAAVRAVVAAWREQGRTVYGASLAWRQAVAGVTGVVPQNELAVD